MPNFKLDEVDHKILDMLIDNTRIPFTDISKKLLISAGTVHVRVKKMEDAGIIKGSSLNVDYEKLGYSFIAYVGIFLEKNNTTQKALQDLSTAEALKQDKVEDIINDFLFTGRMATEDEVIEALEKQPSVLQRESISTRITEKIKDFVKTFINGVDN